MTAVMTPAGRALLLGSQVFSPLSISGLKFWVAADRITGLVDGDPVGTWNDLSGNSNDAIQVTASKKPTYKVAIQNGKPGVQTDGVDDVLQVTSCVLPTFVTLYLVGKFTTAKPFFIEHGPNINTTDGAAWYGSNLSPWGYRRSAIHSAAGTSSWFGSVAGNATYTYDGSGVYSLNGTVQANGSISGTARSDSTVTAALNIASRNGGSAVWTDGYWHEVCLYAGAHSAAVQAQVQAYLRAKWGTP